MNRPHLALLLSITLAAATAVAGEDWVMPPKAYYPAPGPTKAVGGEDWTVELGRQLSILKRQPANR